MKGAKTVKRMEGGAVYTLYVVVVAIKVDK